MTQKTEEYLIPSDPEQAVELLAQYGRKAWLLAGGTSLAFSPMPREGVVIDLTRIGHADIRFTSDEWRLGCNVRMQALAEHPVLKTFFHGMLAEAAAAVGSHPIRNMVTVGGNAVQVFRWSDLPVAYLAVDARFHVLGSKESRVLTADEFYTRHPRQVLKKSEILTEIRVRVPKGITGAAFTKLARSAVDLAIVDVAVSLRLNGDEIDEIRIAIGGTKSLPWRAIRSERCLQGKVPTPERIAQAANYARQDTQTAADIRTSAEHRLRMVEVTVRRTLERALRLAHGDLENYWHSAKKSPKLRVGKKPSPPNSRRPKPRR